jgi:hypothetical protein
MSVNRHDRWYESISRIRAPIFGLDWVTSNGLWSRRIQNPAPAPAGRTAASSSATRRRRDEQVVAPDAWEDFV